ncbi:pyridoxal-dependent decarboxylase, exosortase A system-associated [Sphingomonas sp. MAH-20]|uniref:Pyridoxal-dependent decarboxylase, exosortase A system-associated n=1 Tax=Sphingomonas horti TaxID=2682842 RepID=A0A6I4J0D9_9SPHN|nr:pyridoxal-dependent decarboxylase, exosortase A system-associated [Sphingomonas sp. CGMCC 1.13658]MBA2920026.1 pyridoxal-dependent decarboxylase, exosortase A system-associated [Sphingomonas sp. CGMCC 1.13658]MVO77907.1 pyridoxal-dependent decarboxylase, exosortase A system-associated [Sphingomonas horti]
MKPMGPIPADFRARGGALLIGGQKASALAERAGETPLFVYDIAMVEARIARFRTAFPSIDLHYALKANPFAALVHRIVPLVDGIDVASGGEARAATEAGMAGFCVSFAGPGKRDAELEFAIHQGITINLESENEAARALAVGARIGVRPRLAVRVNPEFELRGSGMRMGGGAKPFGVDAARVPALARRIVAEGAEFRGFHIFAGSQSLDADAIVEAQTATVALAARLAEEAGAAPPRLNLGGGFGIPYFAGDSPLDIERIGAALEARYRDRPAALADTRFCLELGRWLVGEAGVYLTRVVDRKESGGQIFLIVDGGLHHQLAASGNFGAVVRRNYPIAVADRFGAESEEVANVCGCLCTPLDRLGDQVAVPRAQVGDLIAIFLAGAYGASASPSAFLGHGPAQEVLV